MTDLEIEKMVFEREANARGISRRELRLEKQSDRYLALLEKARELADLLRASAFPSCVGEESILPLTPTSLQWDTILTKARELLRDLESK